MPELSPAPEFQAVIVDYGGVLTSPIRESMAAFCAADDIDPAAFEALMREWLTPGSPVNPVHQLETGEITAAEFEAALAGRLTTSSGAALRQDGLLARMFAGSLDEPKLVNALHRVKAAGLKVGLLSNSWGNDYPVHLWGDVFDDMVMSGQVGLRKPDTAIYELAATRLGVPPAAAVFVDDIAPNIRGAVAAGMTGILHTSADETIAELSTLLNLPLAA